MDYKILDVSPLDRTLLIEWQDGVTLNHHIPVDYLVDVIQRSSTLIKNRPYILHTLDNLIRQERN